jgi:hypothetical protein
MATSAPSQDRPLRELHVVVERITYQNAENGFTVARLVTVVGTLADLTLGEAIVAHGWWRNDAKHGWQFQARDYPRPRRRRSGVVKGYSGAARSGVTCSARPLIGTRATDLATTQTFLLTLVDAAVPIGGAGS